MLYAARAEDHSVDFLLAPLFKPNLEAVYVGDRSKGEVSRNIRVSLTLSGG